MRRFMVDYERGSSNIAEEQECYDALAQKYQAYHATCPIFECEQRQFLANQIGVGSRYV